MEDKYDLIVNSCYGEHLLRAYGLDIATIVSMIGQLRTLYEDETLIIGVCPVQMHEEVLQEIARGEKDD